MTQQLLEPYVVEFLSVGSEYFINSEQLENKVRNLLPSQGGAGAGFDLSASTQIIPIIDLTESAEGSNLRVDLQSAFSFTTATPFNVSATTTTIVNTTGYWRILGVAYNRSSGGSIRNAQIIINDGSTDKIIQDFSMPLDDTERQQVFSYDFIIKLESGHTLKMFSEDINNILSGSVRQIAAIDGTLTNP
tara:strand:- start:1 stop:570 length:570 start_codon:yes stop_codon:yes gene_type:complete